MITKIPAVWRRWFWFGIAVGCVLLFVREPGPEQHRLWRQIWDLGHVILFFLIGAIAGRVLTPYKRWSQYLVALVAAAAVGWLIELLQLAVGRDYSLLDVGSDTLGMAVGLLLGAFPVLSATRRIYVVVCIALALVMLVRVRPVVASAVDAVVAWQMFPVLADFDYGFRPGMQRDRFNSRSANLSVKDHALLIELMPGEYPGFGLDDFPNDWRGWKTLVIELENPLSDTLPMVCRIHDAEHERSGNRFEDRFNHRYPIAPGANRLRIDLAEVERAPASRRMDMSEIRDPMCFSINLPQPHPLLLKRIYLE